MMGAGVTTGTIAVLGDALPGFALGLDLRGLALLDALAFDFGCAFAMILLRFRVQVSAGIAGSDVHREEMPPALAYHESVVDLLRDIRVGIDASAVELDLKSLCL